MAQPGEARKAPMNARVGKIQRWIVGVAVGCWVTGIILAFSIEFQPDKSLLASDGIVSGLVYLLIGLGWLAYFAGQGLLMSLRPQDVQGRLRAAAERTDVPRFYGLVLIWSGICLVLVLWLFDFYLNQLPYRDYYAIFDAMVGLFVAGTLPLLILEAYGWLRRHVSHGTP